MSATWATPPNDHDFITPFGAMIILLLIWAWVRLPYRWALVATVTLVLALLLKGLIKATTEDD